MTEAWRHEALLIDSRTCKRRDLKEILCHWGSFLQKELMPVLWTGFKSGLLLSMMRSSVIPALGVPKQDGPRVKANLDYTVRTCLFGLEKWLGSQEH